MNYKFIGIDFSRQTNTTIFEQITVMGKLYENGATVFDIVGIQQKPILNFSLDSLVVTEYGKQWTIKNYWIYGKN